MRRKELRAVLNTNREVFPFNPIPPIEIAVNSILNSKCSYETACLPVNSQKKEDN
jgi:hypothetical protein